MEIAENILIITPMKRVRAKPFIILVENQNKIKQEIKVVRLPSRIDGQARLNPSSMAEPSGLPRRSSSFVLSKIRTFASTAIPIDRMKPAIPARVSVTGISLNIAKMSAA